MLSSFKPKYFPSSLRRVFSGFSEIQRLSSVYSSMYSQYSPPAAFVDGRIHTSGSAEQEVKPRCLMQACKWFLKSRPADFPPYKARWIKATRPMFSRPNSGPHIMKSFWDDGA